MTSKTRTYKNVGSQASCHQRIALICDDVQAKITQIFSFVSLSYRLLAVDEDDGTPLCVRRPNTLDQSGIDEHKPSDCPSQKSCLRRTKILSRIGSVHRAFSRAPYTGMWLLKNPAVLKISEVACTRSGKGPAYGQIHSGCTLSGTIGTMTEYVNVIQDHQDGLIQGHPPSMSGVA